MHLLQTSLPVLGLFLLVGGCGSGEEGASSTGSCAPSHAAAGKPCGKYTGCPGDCACINLIHDMGKYVALCTRTCVEQSDCDKGEKCAFYDYTSTQTTCLKASYTAGEGPAFNFDDFCAGPMGVKKRCVSGWVTKAEYISVGGLASGMHCIYVPEQKCKAGCTDTSTSAHCN